VCIVTQIFSPLGGSEQREFYLENATHHNGVVFAYKENIEMVFTQREHRKSDHN
jgi:hypothetical protein